MFQKSENPNPIGPYSAWKLMENVGQKIIKSAPIFFFLNFWNIIFEICFLTQGGATPSIGFQDIRMEGVRVPTSEIFVGEVFFL